MMTQANKRQTRRAFLKTSTHAVTGLAMTGLGLSAGLVARARGANERVQVAWIGAGGRGSYLVRYFTEAGAAVTHVCDLHPDRLAAGARLLTQLTGRSPKITKRLDEVVEDAAVDAVIVSTPDHWHGPATIRACQAGKDVYVEKPHAHNIWESRKMIEAARKYRRIVQVGTQNRSAPYNQAAREYIQSGKLGRIHLVKVFNLKPGGAFRLGDPGRQPEGFDWNTWLGPAPWREFHQRIFNHGWHQFWDFSGGDLADDGIHQLDLAMMLMGNPGPPHAVSCSGGRLAHAGDDSEVPDLQVAAFDFDSFVMTLEHSNYPRYMEKTTQTIRRNDLLPYWTTNATRVELYGSEYLMTIGRHGGGWVVQTVAGEVVDKMYGRPSDLVHVQNFLECVKTRAKPNADVETLHPSCSMVHLANIAHRVGNVKLRYDGRREQFEDCPPANALIKRKYRPQFAVPDVV